jgi:hypothetical protein
MVKRLQDLYRERLEREPLLPGLSRPS